MLSRRDDTREGKVNLTVNKSITCDNSKFRTCSYNNNKRSTTLQRGFAKQRQEKALALLPCTQLMGCGFCRHADEVHCRMSVEWFLFGSCLTLRFTEDDHLAGACLTQTHTHTHTIYIYIYIYISGHTTHSNRSSECFREIPINPQMIIVDNQKLS